MFDLPSQLVGDVFVMRNCKHNEKVGLFNRYLKDTPNMSKIDWALVDIILDELYQKCMVNYVKSTSTHFLTSKTGKLGCRYNKAAIEILEKGFDLSRDSQIKYFVKNEKYNELKAPRGIMGRDPKFNLVFSKYIEPIEKAFLKVQQVCSAKNYEEKAEMFSKFVGWYGENDFSKFEGSQRSAVLRNIEYKFYRKFYPSDDNFTKLFAATMLKRGQTINGIQFEFEWCRGSGDLTTTLGNGLLNYVSTKYFLLKNNCDTENFQIAGDDGLMQLPENRYEYVNTYEHFGFDAKFLVKEHYSEVEFCSGRYIKINETDFLFVQKLDKLLTNVAYCINKDFHYCLGDYLNSLGLLYSTIYKGVPIYEDLGNMLLRNGLKGRFLKEANSHFSFQDVQIDLKDRYRIVPEIAFVDVMCVNGYNSGEMIFLKNYLQNLQIDIPTERNLRFKPSQLDKKVVDLVSIVYDLENDVVIPQTDKKLNKIYNSVKSTR